MTKVFFLVFLNPARKMMKLRVKTGHNLFPVLYEFLIQNVLILAGRYCVRHLFFIISVYYCIVHVSSWLSWLH